MSKGSIEGLKLESFYDQAVRAHNGTSFDPEKRGHDHIICYSESLVYELEIIEEHNGDTEKYEKKFKDLYSSWLAAKSRCYSVMITGGANFNNAKHQKLNDYEHNAYSKFIEWREKVINRVTRPESTDIVKGSDGAIEKMQEKLKGLETLQHQMKEGNKIIRSKNLTDDEKISKLSSLFPLFTDEQLNEVKNLERYGRPGYAGFELTNNNAKIKTLKNNIASETRRLSKYSNGNKERVVNGITIIENVEENRLQLRLLGKPSHDVRSILKSNGFRWSPRFEAWQRQLTNNALWALDRLEILKDGYEVKYD